MRTITFAILISLSSAFFAQTSSKWTVLGKEYAVDTLKHCQIGPGTTLTIVDLTGPNKQRVFYTTTDLTNPIVEIKTICGKNNLKSNLTIPQMIENNGDKANEYFVGVNADLFSANGPIGTTVVGSEIFKTARTTTGWYSVGADASKKLHYGQFYTTFKLTSATAGQMSAKSVNTPRESNDFVIYTDKYGTSTGTKSSGVEVAAVAIDGGLSAYGTSRFRITSQPQTNVGNMAIPANGIVFSANASWYMEPLQKLQIGDIVEITPTFTINGKVVDQITEMSGGCPMILQDGQILDTDKVLDHLSYRRPRTAIGTDKSGNKMTLMVVDGDKFNSSISDGVTSKELAGMMLMAGCNNALNFDGGGSSTIYSEILGTLNRPSDGSLRKVRNGWFLAAHKTTDTDVATIAFSDYAKNINVSEAYQPIVYGYNNEGYLINVNLSDCLLSCTPSNGVEISGNTATFNAAGIYSLEATYGSATTSMTINVSDKAGISAIAGDELSIRCLDSEVEVSMPYESEVRLLNSMGVCLKTEKFIIGINHLTTSGLTPGLYFIATKKEIIKIIIK